MKFLPLLLLIFIQIISLYTQYIGDIKLHKLNSTSPFEGIVTAW
jgi:phage-related holin